MSDLVLGLFSQSDRVGEIRGPRFRGAIETLEARDLCSPGHKDAAIRLQTVLGLGADTLTERQTHTKTALQEMSSGLVCGANTSACQSSITSGGLKVYREPRLLIRRLGMCKEAIKRVDQRQVLAYPGGFFFETLMS